MATVAATKRWKLHPGHGHAALPANQRTAGGGLAGLMDDGSGNASKGLDCLRCISLAKTPRPSTHSRRHLVTAVVRGRTSHESLGTASGRQPMPHIDWPTTTRTTAFYVQVPQVDNKTVIITNKMIHAREKSCDGEQHPHSRDTSQRLLRNMLLRNTTLVALEDAAATWPGLLIMRIML